MRFPSSLIERAKTLRKLGLEWEPQVGHYVFDGQSLIEKSSPFQPGVYYILDLKHFLRRAGTIDALKVSFVWLPTWHDARNILRELNVSDAFVADRLTSERAIERGDELMLLYDLIAERLQSRHT